MPVPDYLRESDKAQRLADTREMDITAAFIAAANTTLNAEGEVNYRALDAQPARTAFTAALNGSLEAKAQAYFGIPAARMADPFIKSTLGRAYVGFGSEDVSNLVEQAKGRMNKSVFDQNTEEPFTNVRKQLARVPLSQLVAADAPAVIAYLQNTPSDHRNDAAIALIDPAKLTNPVDMAQLIGEYKAKDILSPRFIEGKSYHV